MKLENLTPEKQAEVKAHRDEIKLIIDEGSFSPAYKHVRKETAKIFREGGQEIDKRKALVKACEEAIEMVSI